MLVLVIGGSGSGKSEYAEDRCVQLGSLKKIYIATMEPYDEESFRRIARHQNMRAGKGFETIECYTHLEDLQIEKYATVLLECMSNLVANEMFSPDGRKEEADTKIIEGVKNLVSQAQHVVIVTNQVFSDGITYDPETMKYLQKMAAVNQAIGIMADEVIEVIHGIPIGVKNEAD